MTALEALAPLVYLGGMGAIAAGSLWAIDRWMPPVPPTGIDESRALWDELARIPDAERERVS